MTKRGLGRGLGALIPTDISDESIQEIDLDIIFANEDQPRKTFDKEKIQELAKSIKTHGVLQPVLLRKRADKYELIAGERRWRAAKQAGLKEIPAIVKDITDTEAMEIALIENLQREDLNPLEEALAYQKLMDDFGLTQEELSNRIGKSRSQIANTIRLLNLDEEIKQMIAEDEIKAGHARAILSIPDKNERIKLASKIRDESLSVRDVEKIAKTHSKKPTNKKEYNPAFVEISNNLQSLLGTKVRLKGSERRGKIEIEFYSVDELGRILDILLG